MTLKLKLVHMSAIILHCSKYRHTAKNVHSAKNGDVVFFTDF